MRAKPGHDSPARLHLLAEEDDSCSHLTGFFPVAVLQVLSEGLLYTLTSDRPVDEDLTFYWIGSIVHLTTRACKNPSDDLDIQRRISRWLAMETLSLKYTLLTVTLLFATIAAGRCRKNQ
ncbi:hypothetical protein WG66_013105 [Moniliophthora roreri]|nr:hypothetical protein WG66_013105 [Moniliophthora roreri]